MKVIHVITGLGVGGAESMLHKLLLTQDRGDFESTVVSLVDGGEIHERIVAAGIPVHVLGMKRGLVSPAAILRLRGLARELKPDVIQGWMYHGNLAGSLMSLFAPGSPRLYWNIRHSLYDLSHEKKLTAMVIRLGAVLSNRPEGIIYNSTISSEQHALLGYRRQVGLVVPNGFDLETFRPNDAARAGLRTELGLDPATVLVGVVGRRHPIKGHDDFLRAAAAVNRTYPDVHFVLAGRGVQADDPFFRQFLDGRDLSGRVHFLGQRTDTPDLFAALDLLAMPSLSEGFPNVLGEALACGVPCVTTDVGESREIVGDAGRVVPPADPEAMAAAVCELLGLENEARSEMGRLGREIIRDRYSLAAVAAIYGELYQSR